MHVFSMTAPQLCAHEADLGSSSARWLGSSQLCFSLPDLGSSPKLLFEAKCYILSYLRSHNNSPRFSKPQMHVSPHQLTLGLRGGQLLFVDGNLLLQRQTLRCDGVHFLQGAEWGERKTRSAAVWKVLPLFSPWQGDKHQHIHLFHWTAKRHCNAEEGVRKRIRRKIKHNKSSVYQFISQQGSLSSSTPSKGQINLALDAITFGALACIYNHAQWFWFRSRGVFPGGETVGTDSVWFSCSDRSQKLERKFLQSLSLIGDFTSRWQHSNMDKDFQLRQQVHLRSSTI